MIRSDDNARTETAETIRIQDEAGRIGTVSEVRLYSSGPGLFARPEAMPYIATADLPGLGSVQIITATWWALHDDGTLQGYWCDDPMHTRRTARVIEGDTGHAQNPAAVALGRKGGQAKSEAKSAAARANIRKRWDKRPE